MGKEGFLAGCDSGLYSSHRSLFAELYTRGAHSFLNLHTTRV